MTQPKKRSPRTPYRRHPRGWSQRVTQTSEWANWRQRVFQRDGYRCVMCPKTEAARLAFKALRRHLEPHHIQRKIDHPEIMYDVDNGVTLCDGCHAKVTDHEKDYEARFKAYVRRLREREERLQDMTGLEI